MEANEGADGAPVDMSKVNLGERYSSEDMYRDFPELKPGDRVAVERGGVIHTDTIESVRYSSGSPAIYRTMNRWQRIARRFTPRRWRKSLLAREAQPASLTINGDNSNPVGKTLAQLQEMKTALGRILD